MASMYAQSVYGFGAHLDRRPTVFVPELPSKSLCSLCGLLPAASFILPCKHLLCGSCFYQYRQISDRCPLDQRVFRQEEVAPALIKKDAILGFRIRCWNAGNGCDAEDTVSAMLDHFVNACMFHTLNCRTCGETMLHRELPRHVMSGCAATCSPECTLRETLEKTSRENASVQRELASVEMRAIYAMNKMMDQLSATVRRMRAEAGQSKCTSCSSQIDSWISEIGSIVRTNRNAFMPAFQRNFYHDGQSLNDAAHGAAASRTKNITSTAFLKSSGPTCPGTTSINPVQKTTAEESNVPGHKHPLVNPQRSLPGPHETNLSEIIQCCECIIENWASFSGGTAAADIRNGRCECGTVINAYGFLLVPRMYTTGGKSRVYFTVCAFKGFFGTTHEVPMDSVLRIRLGSRAPGAKDSGIKEQLSWKKVSSPQKIMGEEVLYFSTSKQSLIPRTVEARGFVSDNKVQLRFSVTRW
ncbi:hypothetical protein HPB52_017387 [Rhipicephalus sanguineus]|uniref:RING-type domain-containing protein n=1 Tax=Rhipicephalus sanguineus TaxID=34632 RepID=A0A9D4Q1A9_RHISA|nr:hypothetical protein HPB52_017387 [Rhipicephalus sanguineus]